MLLVANSTPIVDLDSRLNSLRVNLERRLLFPTPESPISTTAEACMMLRTDCGALGHTRIQYLPPKYVKNLTRMQIMQ